MRVCVYMVNTEMHMRVCVQVECVCKQSVCASTSTHRYARRLESYTTSISGVCLAERQSSQQSRLSCGGFEPATPSSHLLIDESWYETTGRVLEERWRLPVVEVFVGAAIILIAHR